MKKMKRRIFSVILACLMLVTVFTGCDPTETPVDDTTDTQAPEDTTPPVIEHKYNDGTFTGKFTCEGLGIYDCVCTECGEAGEVYKEVPDEDLPKHTSVDGTTVMFVGNSFVYYGYCVIDGGQGGFDQGYFYQICKNNGENVKVLDYVYGGKNLDYIYQNNMPKDKNKYKDVDYVFMSEAGENNKDIVNDCKQIMSLCGEDTQFYYLCHLYTISSGHDRITGAFDELRSLGVQIVNWGQLAYDVWHGTAKIPGSTLSYNKQSFVVNKKDSHHQNMLSGYITAQMAYCAITGKSAVGQSYAFCTDKTVNSLFDTERYINNYYNPNTTNFDKVFASPTDMEGFQHLMDEYLVKYKALPETLIKRGNHLYEDVEELLSVGASNFCGVQIKKCRYCGSLIAGETLAMNSKFTNKVFVSFNIQSAAGASSVEDYLNRGLGIYASAQNGVWSTSGATATSLATMLEGRRPANAAPEKNSTIITLADTTAKYSADGSSGSDYIALVDIEFNAPQTFKGYSAFFGGNDAVKAYDIIGGKKNADGTYTWSVLSSHSGALATFDDHTDCMVGNFDDAQCDTVRIAFKDVASTTIYISEFELYG